MISSISVRNFKSVKDVTLGLGRVNVLIGANGCGKSNILEAILMLGAGIAKKADRVNLVARGMRETEPFKYLSMFPLETDDSSDVIAEITATISESKTDFGVRVIPNPKGNELIVTEHWPLFDSVEPSGFLSQLAPQIEDSLAQIDDENVKKNVRRVLPKLLTSFALSEFVTGHQGTESQMRTGLEKLAKLKAKFSEQLSDFMIYAPDYATLRVFEEEGQVLPMGPRGQGLFGLFQKILRERKDEFKKSLLDFLNVLDWVQDVKIPEDLGHGERTLSFQDKYMYDSVWIDQRTSNEGLLFLLFYFLLFTSFNTPKFFAIDNVDASFNPKLATELMRQLVELAAKHDKQVIITTHNPALLDGLNLHDENQRLYAISRGESGATEIERVRPPKAVQGKSLPPKLSEAFLNGLLGGLPKNF
ncbi:AAA family ATPase [Roseimicrobium sp. ORNL1]|uniref:AAA family ATPase n=1 Tax=Roseimicrobium sp. ORNL1 TaxID=2711231 RepID=UPI0013E1C88C|nr:AAA family ATPase [Roseimicrobium sp. ORNL1]QIF02742.1 AAA family ATPase [Roseimicrobium sp. ORNL1]